MDRPQIELALHRVGELLAAAGQSYAIVAIGGAAMSLQGHTIRSTTDVDVIALGSQHPEDQDLEPPVPWPEPLSRAAAIVARDLALVPDWLNAGPADQWRVGLPPGLAARVHWREYDALRVGLADRLDLIFFKLHAAADDTDTRSVHFQDLCALQPTRDELAAARTWILAQEAGPEFPRILDQVIDHVEAR